MLVEIRLKDSTKILLMLVYRPPKIGFLDDFVNAFSNVAHLCTDVIILGDFNADMSFDRSDTRFMKNFINAFDLDLIFSNPTQHVGFSHTWFDVVIISDIDKVSNFF